MCESYGSVSKAVLQDFRETFQETVEYDAGITFTPYVDPFDGSTYGVVIYSNNNAEYVGKVFANIAWEYWDKNVDSVYWPSPCELVDELFDTYLPDSFDMTGAWTNAFAQEVYETAQALVEQKFRPILNEKYDSYERKA
jgi:hypothetical protein